MSEIVPPPEPQISADDLAPIGQRRIVSLLSVVGIGVALVGFITGIREPRSIDSDAVLETVHATPHNESAPAAVNYFELPTAKLGPNARWAQSLADLKYDKPGIFDPVTRTEEMKLAALANRAKNRAYEGAPPTIPHSVDLHSTASCLACHGEGLKVGDRIASKISHANLTNCTQCHVEQPPAAIDNAFVGVYRSGPGMRASPGAPPVIPHRTWMRENCNSCHGLVARPGTRTTHPWLTNCTQCHAISAALDQLDFAGGTR